MISVTNADLNENSNIHHSAMVPSCVWEHISKPNLFDIGGSIAFFARPPPFELCEGFPNGVRFSVKKEQNTN